MAALVDTYAMNECWTTWHTEIREAGGKPSKVPYSLDGRRAKANDPSTWMSYFEAQQCMEKYGHGGINFMLGQVPDTNVHIGGVDIDACIGPEGDVEPWATEIVELLDSYTEVTPSGTGLRIFFTYLPELAERRWRHHVQEPKVEGRPKEPGIEFYLRNHFMSVTGTTFLSYDSIREIDGVVMNNLQALMGKFEARYKDPPPPPRTNGATTHPRRDEPEHPDRIYSAIDAIKNPGFSWQEWNERGMAIYAATNGSGRGYDAFVAFSARDPGKFNERNCRERWENYRRSPPDHYTEGSIYKWARDDGWVDPFIRRRQPNGHDPRYDDEPIGDDINVGLVGKRRQPIWKIKDGDIARFIDVDVPEVEMLVENMLPLYVAGILAGDGGAGKSLLSQLLCTCVATGFAFCGYRVHRGKAVYITGEDPDTVLHNRQHRINQHFDIRMEQYKGRLFLRSILDDDIFLFSDGKITGLQEELVKEIEEITEVTLLIIDSAAIVYDDDEIKRRPVAKFMISLNRIARRLGCTVLLITHKSRSGGSGAGTFTSGSTGWAAHARCGFDIAQTNDEEDESDVVLKLVKPNYTRPIPPVFMRWDMHGVLKHIPDRPTDQLELAVLRTSERNDDHLLIRTIDTQWLTGNGFMKQSAPRVQKIMAREPHKWSTKKTDGVLSRLVENGWVTYSDGGKKRGWRVTETGKAEAGLTTTS